MGKVQDIIQQKTLKTILFVDFFNALKDNDHKSIGCTEDELEDLANEYFSLLSLKKDQMDQQLRSIIIDVNIIESSIILFNQQEYDKDIAKMLLRFGVDCFPDNMPESIVKLQAKLKELYQKYTVLKAQEIKMPQENLSGEDVLAQLSLGLEMKLDFNQVTVSEYISYSKALRKKNASIKQQLKRK